VVNYATAALGGDTGLPDGSFIDLCSLTLEAGKWLVLAQLMESLDVHYTDEYIEMGLWNHVDDTYHSVPWRREEGGWYGSCWSFEVFDLPTGGTISLRARHTRAFSANVGLGDANIDAPPWTHMMAGKIGSTATVHRMDQMAAGTIALTVDRQFYELMQTPVLDKGRWLLLGMAGMAQTEGSDHIYCEFWNGTDTRDFIEDGYAGGGPRTVSYFIQDIVPVKGDAEQWSLLCAANSVGGGRPVVYADTSAIGGLFGSPSSPYAIMLAIQLSAGGEGTEWKTAIPDEEIVVPGSTWVTGAEFTLDEGDWLILGTSHLIHKNPPECATATRLRINGDPMNASLRRTDPDPTYEAVALNTFAGITVPAGETWAVELQAWTNRSGPDEEPKVVLPWETTYVTICPNPSIITVPHPGFTFPASPDNDPKPMAATRLTAVKLPMSMTAVFPGLRMINADGTEDWLRTTPLPG